MGIILTYYKNYMYYNLIRIFYYCNHFLFIFVIFIITVGRRPYNPLTSQKCKYKRVCLTTLCVKVQLFILLI